MALGTATLPPQVIPHPANRAWVSAPADASRMSLRIVAVPLLACALRVASPPTALLAYLLVAAYALMGRSQAIMALFLCCFFNLANHGLPGGAPRAATILRYAIFLAAAVGVFVRGRDKQARTPALTLLSSTLFICLLIMLHSLIASPLVDVSFLKILSFTIVVMTSFAGWSWMDPAERKRTETLLVGGLALLAFASVPMVATSIGYMRNKNLFQGVFVHPNNLGPFMAIGAGILGTQCLTARPLGKWRLVAALTCAGLMYLSRSRVSLVAFVVGIVMALIVDVVRSACVRDRQAPRIIGARLAVAALALSITCALSLDRITQFYADFVTKGSTEVESLTEAYEKSRGGLIEALNRNIRDKPGTGIGFGVPSDPELWVGVDRDPVFGLPLMFTIEKGVMPLAVIEELGYPLATLVFAWLAMLAWRATRGGLVPFTAFAIAMLTNLAESTFFSPGGMGLLIVIVVGWAVTAPPGGAWLRARSLAPTARAPAT